MSQKSNFEFIHKLLGCLDMIQKHINEPDVIQSILSTVLPDDNILDFPEVREDLGMANLASAVPDNALRDEHLDKAINKASEQEQALREAMGTEGKTNEPVTKDTGMSEQEQELRNIFAALKDDPGDNRWED
jgi:hypothetical protein